VTAAARRCDVLIDRERVRNYSLIFLVLGSVALLVNVLCGDFPLTLAGGAVLPDYLAHWTGGRMILDGQLVSLYDPAAQARLQHELVPGSVGVSWFVSPPVAVWLYVPLAWLPYGVSAVAWTALSAGLLAASLVLSQPPSVGLRRRDYRIVVVVFAASAPVLELLGGGQDSAVALVMLMLGIRLLAGGQNVLAGCVLALGVLKPQLFVLVPVALIVQQRYRAAVACASAALVLCGLTVVALGVSPWQSWWAALTSPLYQESVQVGQTWKMQSVSSLLTALGAPTTVSYLVLALGVAALVLRTRRIRHDSAQVWALTVLTTVVFSPHVMLYDLVLLLPAMTWVAYRLNVRAVRLLSVALAALLATVALRYAVSSQGQDGWPLLAAPWSALTLLGLWFIMMRFPPTAGVPDPWLPVDGPETLGHNAGESGARRPARPTLPG
jgi:hypothetical protein